jgi:hypothetical protein
MSQVVINLACYRHVVMMLKMHCPSARTQSQYRWTYCLSWMTGLCLLGLQHERENREILALQSTGGGKCGIWESKKEETEAEGIYFKLVDC